MSDLQQKHRKHGACFLGVPLEKSSVVWIFIIMRDLSNIIVRDINTWLVHKIQNLNDSNIGSGGLAEYLFIVLWCIWKKRNNYYFENRRTGPYAVVEQTNMLWTEQMEVRRVSQNLDRVAMSNASRHRSWCPFEIGSVKVNVDVAFEKEFKCRVVVVVVRDEKGIMLSGCTRRIACNEPLQAEAITMKEGILLAHCLGIGKVCFETDNATTVKRYKDQGISWQVEAIVGEVR